MDMPEQLQREDSAVAYPPRRWIRRALIILLQALVLGGGLVMASLVTCKSAKQDCATAARTRAPDGIAVTICQREYERTRHPATGAHFAEALRRSGNVTAAAALANDLLHTEARSDALYVLGRIAVTQNRLDDGVTALQEALKLHREQNRHAAVAKDLKELGEVQNQRLQFSEALQIFDECIAEARSGSDPVVEGYCHLNASRVLIQVGYFEAASQELDRVEPLFSSDYDLAWLWYERGNLHQEIVRSPDRHAHDKQAVGVFQRALELARATRITRLVRSIHLNLAYSLAELGQTDDADRQLEEAALLDSDKAYENERAQLAARIAYRRGNIMLAYSMNERVFAKLEETDDDRIIVSMMQARIAIASNDLVAAEQWARRGVETAEKIRSEQTVAELRSWVLASRREPYEVLFTVLERVGRIEQAIEVFDQWQGRTMLDAMARPSLDATARLSSTAGKVRGLGLWLPSVSNAPLMKLDGRGVVDTLRKIDLIALAAVEGGVWRLTASHGRFRIDRLASIEALADRLDRFRATPTDRALADELGALILPEELVQGTSEPLYVVLDAPLAALPFPALRRGDRPVIAARPVIRAPRLPAAATSCTPQAGVGNAVVLADVAGDLPDARRESSKVASLFGGTPFVGAAATSTALFAAKPDSLLHVAVHAGVDGIGVLKLHDRVVSAPEISATKLGPALVVLSACSTADSRDPELAGSLSTAFLVGGSNQVVATLRPITDAGALEITSRFYAAGGVQDPVHVLARIQAQLAGSDNKDWPNFAVFGGNICAPRS
jgi:tetratricopeptide (TPR) repeat protein